MDHESVRNPTPARLVIGAALLLLATGCSGAEAGKKNGEPCSVHSECASNLCTIPPAADAGAADGGLAVKRCVEPDVNH